MASVSNNPQTDELIYKHFRKVLPKVNVADYEKGCGDPATWIKMLDVVAPHIKKTPTEATPIRKNVSAGYTRDNTTFVCYAIAATFEIARRKEILGYQPKAVVTMADFVHAEIKK
jgi:hypothetical protein